jgi:hypothetical protein
VDEPGRGRRAITTPALDALLIGGLSLALGVVLLLVGRDTAGQWAARAPVSLTQTFLLNAPHFMASSFLLYGSRALVRRHPWASFGVPALLLAWVAVAVALASRTRAPLTLLQAVGAYYLAWHYTGQAWGMIAVASYVDGFSWSALERGLVRGGLRLLLVWHVLWAARQAGQHLPHEEALRVGSTWLAAASVPLGLAGAALLFRRTGRLPSWRAAIPWLAVHAWYLGLSWSPAALFWVQGAHALQYLAFPARVEANRHATAPPPARARHMVVYGVVLVLVGVTVFALVPALLAAPAVALGGAAGPATFKAGLLAAVNVHHYFTDGCVWKVSNPEVRRELLAHLAPAKPPAPVVAAPAPPATPPPPPPVPPPPVPPPVGA